MQEIPRQARGRRTVVERRAEVARHLDQHAVPGTERLRGRDVVDGNVRQRRQGLHDLVEDRRCHVGATLPIVIVDGHRRQQLSQLGVRRTKECRFVLFIVVVVVRF